MARISGVTLISEKQIQIALTYIYGIGLKTSNVVLTKAKIDPTVRVKNLTDTEISMRSSKGPEIFFWYCSICEVLH